MEPQFTKLRRRVILLVLLVLAVIFTLFTFTESKTEIASTLILYAFITALVLVIIGVFLKKWLSPNLTALIEKAQVFFKILAIITREVVPNRVGILLCLVLLIIFSAMGQAQELLLLLSETQGTPPIFFSFLIILALSSWYWTRFSYSENIDLIEKGEFLRKQYKAHAKTSDPEVNHIRKVFPKLLGFFIILIPTFFILGLYLENVKEEHGFLVIISTGLMYLALLIIGYAFVKVKFYNYIKDLIKRRKWLIWCALGLIAGLIIIPVSSGREVMYSPTKIPFLYLSGGAISMIYFFIASLELEKKIPGLKMIPALAKLNIIQVGTLIASLFTVLFFLFYNFWGLWIDINGLSILLVSLIFYTFFAYLMFIIGGRFKLPILTIILIGGMFYSYKNSPDSNLHNVRLVDAEFNPDNRLSIEAYIEAWFEDADRQKDIAKYKADTTKQFPIVFISSEGGGSRAAYWTLLVHDALEHSIENYYQHIFSMSGASGGNTGNSFYLAYRDFDVNHEMKTARLAEEVFQNDFVSSDIGMLFGRDAWQSTIAVHWGADRSEFLQQKWEKAFAMATTGNEKLDDNPLKRGFLSFWYSNKGTLRQDHPLFLLHTTHVQSGDHATLSAVKLDDFIPQNMDLLKQTYNEKATKNKTIPLSSGALLNSRFPIICPSGKIPNVGNFVDAGYYDNFGAAETRAAMNAVIKYIEKTDYLDTSDFDIVHLVFRNGLPHEDDSRKLHEDSLKYVSVRSNLIKGIFEEYKRYESVAESLVPLSALAGAAFAHPNRELAEAEYVSDITIYFDLRRTKVPFGEEGELVTPIIPLSRHLSYLARISMSKCIENIMSDKEMKLKQHFILK